LHVDFSFHESCSWVFSPRETELNHGTCLHSVPGNDCMLFVELFTRWFLLVKLVAC